MEFDLFLLFTLGFSIFCAFGLVNEFIKDFNNRSLKICVRRRVPYSKIINEVVRWTGPILLDSSIKKYPKIKVSYRKCKRAAGYYYPKSKTVEVFVNRQIYMNGIVFVCLHEIAHYIQHQTNPEFQNYDSYEYKLGYDKNPFEIQANSFASKHRESCLRHLQHIGYI